MKRTTNFFLIQVLLCVSQSFAAAQQRGALSAPFCVMRMIDELISVSQSDLSKIRLTNQQQNDLIEKYKSYEKQGHDRKITFSEDELNVVASIDAGHLNKLLANGNFNVKIAPFTNLNQFGVVAIQKLSLEWAQKGDVKRGERRDGRYLYEYPAIQLKRQQGSETYIEMNYLEEGIYTFKLKTKKEKDVVCFASRCNEKNNEEKNYFDKLPTKEDVSNEVARLRKIMKDGNMSARLFSYLNFPMIDCSVLDDVRGLLDLDFDTMVVKTAKQEIQFKMDEFGAQLQTAVAVTGAFRGVHHDSGYTIEKPFLIWIERKGIEPTVFEGYMTTDYWKGPNIQRWPSIQTAPTYTSPPPGPVTYPQPGRFESTRESGMR